MMQAAKMRKLAPAQLTKVGLKFRKAFATPNPIQPDSKQSKAADMTFGKTHKYARTVGQARRLTDTTAVKGIQLPNIVISMIRPAKPMRDTEVVFKVPLNLNKLQIKDYIEEVYRTPVMRVQTSIFLGKLRLNKNGFWYRRPDWKKAVVRLTEPFKFPSFTNMPTAKATVPIA
jgi:ribosomal protein L23